MTAHVPAHPSRVPHIHVSHEAVQLTWLAVILAAIMAVFLVLPRVVTIQVTSVTEAQSLIEFRAAERPDVMTSPAYLIDFRAGERAALP